MFFALDSLIALPRCRATLRSAATANAASTQATCGYSRCAIGWCRFVTLSLFLLILILLKPPSAEARGNADSPAFTTVRQLQSSFDLLYEQHFAQARQGFQNWELANPKEPFGEVAIAASYLFEELYRQNVLTSDFFLDDNKFLRGIDGQADPARMADFRQHLAKARQLARERQNSDSNDREALFALTLSDGMEADALSILERKQLDALKHMKEANAYAKRLLAQHPDASDVCVATGIANYIIGSLGAGSRFGLWFRGIHGNKKVGMDQLASAAEKGRYLRPFAKIVLALAARRENQNALAQALLRGLKEQYPNNALYAAEYVKALHPSLSERP